MATGSPWNDGGFAFSPNTNTLDRESMPSAQAEAARQKSAQVMAALKSGEPGAADRVMGDQKESGSGRGGGGGSKGVFPLQWMKAKMGGGGGKAKRKAGREDGKGLVVEDDESMMSGTTLGEEQDPTIKKM